ncbi:MAG: succinate dehydrogenase, cytochrome b556 subunit [Pseudomonadota bacterium]
MADVNRGDRPLSPHIMIYKPQLTSMSSIMVRITGIALLFLSAIIVVWLVAAAASETAFAAINGVMQSWFGDLVLLAGLWALCYHLLGRLRHVIWDFGYGWKVEQAETMALVMFALPTVITVLTFFVFLIG